MSVHCIVNFLMNLTSWNKLYPFIAEFLKDTPETPDGTYSASVRACIKGNLVVKSIAEFTTRKEIIMELSEKILNTKNLNDETKRNVIRILLDQ